MIAATPGAGNLASFVQLYVLLGGYLAIVVALTIFGRPRPAAAAGAAGASDSGDASTSGLRRFLLRVPRALERITGIPGWAAASVGTALFGLLVAGIGFYADVAWHIALGRDQQLFTAPHTEIVVGLAFIEGSAMLGILFANLQGRRRGLRLPGSRIWVPWSMLPMAALGGAAVLGFPLDDLWHARYGIDVTMWSPTHMLMICGAALSGMASWLILADAGVSPRTSRWSGVVHVLAGVMTMMGLTAVQGEFAFGVPQFQQLYLPVLIAMAAGIGLVAIRLVLGPWRALVITAVVGATGALQMRSQDVPAVQRAGALYIVSAIVVELAGRFIGTERRLRFALVSGFGIATFGLAGEWMWNQGARQPWHASLLPPALLVGGLMAVSAAVVGAGFGGAISKAVVTDRTTRGSARALPRLALPLAGLGVLVALIVPFPRTVGNVSAALQIRPAGTDQVLVSATLTPANAADDNLWFQVTSWQGGKLVVADLRRDAAAGPGHWVATKPVLASGGAKVVLRLARGAQMMVIPVRFPADAEIGKPAIEPVDRTQGFEKETRYLLREQHGGGQAFAYFVYVLLAAVVALWLGSFLLATTRLDAAGASDDAFSAGGEGSGDQRRPLQQPTPDPKSKPRVVAASH